MIKSCSFAQHVERNDPEASNHSDRDQCGQSPVGSAQASIDKSSLLHERSRAQAEQPISSCASMNEVGRAYPQEPSVRPRGHQQCCHSGGAVYELDAQINPSANDPSPGVATIDFSIANRFEPVTDRSLSFGAEERSISLMLHRWLEEPIEVRSSSVGVRMNKAEHEEEELFQIGIGDKRLDIPEDCEAFSAAPMLSLLLGTGDWARKKIDAS